MGNFFSIYIAPSNISKEQRLSTGIAQAAASKVAKSFSSSSSDAIIRSEYEIKALGLTKEQETLLKVIQHIFVPCHDFADIKCVKMINTAEALAELKQELVYFTHDPEHFVLSEKTDKTMLKVIQAYDNHKKDGTILCQEC